MKILVINGPNINFLGIREPEIYGKATYADLLELIEKAAAERGVEVAFFQSNHEGALVDAIQQAYFDGVDGIIINPAAYTHTSVAILDAVKAVGIPTVEVHISDVRQREDFRQVSYIRQACAGTVMGKGFDGYVEAMDVLLQSKDAYNNVMENMHVMGTKENCDWLMESKAQLESGVIAMHSLIDTDDEES